MVKTTPAVPAHEAQSVTKIEALESIRGLAAMLIVLFHVPHWNASFNMGFINNSYLMVDLFFVLSGFVICKTYADRIHSGRDLACFQFLRFGRLYPVHLVFLLVFLAIETAKYLSQKKLGVQSANTQPFSTNNLHTFVQHLFLVQGMGPTGNPMTFNIPAWSISVEFYTYLVFGLSVMFFDKWKSHVHALIAVAVLLLLLTDQTFGFSDFLRCLLGFFLGCLSATLLANRKLNIPKITSLLVLVAFAAYLHYKTPDKDDMYTYAFATALVISVVAASDGYLNKILSWRFFVWLGSISYAVYMSHLAILWFSNQIIRMVLKRPEAPAGRQKFMTPQLEAWEAWLALGLVFAVILVVSVLVHKYLENPWRQKSRAFAFRTFRALPQKFA
ncbi:acyltransferase family protein [Roseateles sp. BYS180W]|uniref:Acyltransferase family protein n=1 Tax=Roseateles rivi TaxID=3299028 RepID=A0ABW7FTE0_9BURK